MIYCFKCVTPEHPADKPREFEAIVHHVPKKVINQYPCPECGGVGKRDMSKEIPTQAVVGLTPISTSTTVPGSMYHETKFAFGKRKVNPDGTMERNHAAFRDSGELSKFMNGHNDMGEPVLDDRGNPLRRKDGSIVRRGAKLVKLSGNATPSRNDVRRSRPPVPDASEAWVDEGSTKDVSVRDSSLGYREDGKEIRTQDLPRYHSPKRGAE